MIIDRDTITVIVNFICKHEQPPGEHTPIEDPDELLSTMGLDSLDYMMLYIWISDIYGITEDQFKVIEKEGDITLTRFQDFIISIGTQSPTLRDAKDIYNGTE